MRMRRLLIILFPGILLLHAPGAGQAPAWPVGEQLLFDLSYGWIKGGEGSMYLAGDPRDSTLLRVVAEAHTIGIFAFFSPVRDSTETFFRRRDGYPVKTVRKVSRGKKSSQEVLLFMDENHRVRSSRSGDHLYRERIFDILSAFYQARRRLQEVLPAEPGGEVLHLPLFFDGKLFDLRLKYAGKETLRTLYGKQVCLRFVPDTTGNRTFTDERQLQIWVTGDERRLPVKITARLPVGSFRGTLKEVRER